MFEFRLIATDGRARAGELVTPHGVVETPVFMPVGTQATVKTLTVEQLRRGGRDDAAGEHLSPAPAAGRGRGRGARRAPPVHELAAADPHRLGGIPGLLARRASQGHRRRRRLSEPHRRLAPRADARERARHRGEAGRRRRHAARRMRGVPRDERSHAKEAMERTIAWAKRSIEHQRRDGTRGTVPTATRTGTVPSRQQALFGIVQGATYADLRVECARRLVAMDFPGYAIGGLSVGEGPQVMNEMLDVTVPELPEGEAALPDGRRAAGGSARRGRARDRHVRLRAADAQRAQRLRVHVDRHHPHEEPEARALGRAARRVMPLPHLRELLARLHPPPLPREANSSP